MNPQPDTVIHNFGQIPIQPSERRRTDVCCSIVSTLLVITLFVVALGSFNRQLIYRWQYPSDSAGMACGQDYPQQPYLYFASVVDTSKRLCLSECPRMGDISVHSYPLECFPNILQVNHVEIYDTEPQITKMGMFCFPTDPILKQTLMLKSGILDRYRVLQAFKTVGLSFVLALVLGIVFMLLVQCLPQPMVSASMVLGGISMVVLGLLAFINKPQGFQHLVVFRVVCGMLAMVIGVLLMGMVCFCKTEIRIIGVFLRYSGFFLKATRSTYLVILVYLVLFTGFVALFVFQFLAFFSLGEPVFSVASPYYELRSTLRMGVLQLLNIVEIYWGLHFLREACVFVVSGLAAQWYIRRPQVVVNPAKNLILYNWGSVVACAFMVGFFGLLDMIYLLITPQQGRLARLGGCGKLCTSLTSPLESISMYIRQESMTYINLTGIPYCNASVYCQYLNWESQIKRGKGSRPIIRYYRYGAYAFLVSILLIFGVLYENATIGATPFLSLLTIGVVGLFIVAGFADIHADVASALMVTFMLEEHLEGSFDNVKQAPQGMHQRLAFLIRPH